MMEENDKILVDLFLRSCISVETLAKVFGISMKDFEDKDKSVEKIEEYDFMFLDLD